MATLIWIQKLSLICLTINYICLGYDLTNEYCFDFNADSRENVDIMNNKPGDYMNMFPKLSVNQTVRVKNITYYAAGPGFVYVSFWGHQTGNEYKLVAKILLQSVQAGRQSHVPENHIQILEGASLGVHYNSNGDGVIFYERSNFPNRDTSIVVYDVLNVGNIDNDWEVGENGFVLDFGKVSTFQRTAAIHMTVCACKSGYYGPSCIESCSGNCYNDSVCDHVDGACNSRCKDGYNYTASQQCETECSDRTYGENCTGRCTGNCYNGLICDKVRGHCTQCIAGYNFTASALCDKECDKGTYGINCNRTCSGNCLDGEDCRVSDGICMSGCAPGYDYSLTATCHLECRGDTYGLNCSRNCSGNCYNNEQCDIRHGECQSGCRPGYNYSKSPTCHEVCDNGTYGLNCSGNCSGNCRDEELCDVHDGSCRSKCTAGFEFELSPACDQECAAGRFGLDCEGYCHCINDLACDNVIGSCPKGCSQGWTGLTCSLPLTENGKEEGKGSDNGNSGNDVGLGVGLAVALVIILVSCIVSAVVLMKRRRESQGKAVDDAPMRRSIAKETVLPNDINDTEDEGENEVESEANGIYQNEKPEAQTTLVNVADFHEAVMKLTVEDMGMEFMSLPKGQTKPWTKATDRELVPKNKFKNILPYDVNRVILDMVDDDPKSKYINATFIPGYEHGEIKKFIASQGPQKATVHDFWRMIWKYKVHVVVMLTNLIENMKIKCVKYWPDNGYVTYGGIQLALVKEEHKTDVVIRHIKATKDDDTRLMYLIHYEGWPDHDVPICTSIIFDLLNDTRNFNSASPDSPIIVHCSAGVGRTGTLLSIDYLTEQAKHTQRLDVLTCVAKLRGQRVNMVQTSSQYRFIYRAMDEYLALGGDHVIHKAKGPEELIHLLHTEEGQTKLAKQYQFLEDTKPKYKPGDYQLALADANRSKNRNSKILPTNAHRFRLETEDGAVNDYINAITIQVSKYKLEYCVTQIPLEDTARDFWQLMAENNIQNIVVFNPHQASTRHWLPVEDETLNLVKCSITSQGSEKQGVCIVSHVCVIRSGEYADETDGDVYINMSQANSEQIEYANTEQDAFKMEGRLFMCTEFDTADVDSTIDSIINLQEVIKPHLVAGQPVAVVCLDGACESGVFVACDILSHALTNQPTYDVFSTVQMIRVKRPQFIRDVSEYSLIHAYAMRRNENMTSDDF